MNLSLDNIVPNNSITTYAHCSRLMITFSLISLFFLATFSCGVRVFEGSSSVAAKGPSAVGTGLRRDDPPPDDTADRYHLDNLWQSGILESIW